MILSGGLGSSAYVRERLQQTCMHICHPNAPGVSVIPCQDPQLVVVRGLLLDRQQKMETGNISVLASRIARASYGVVVQELYSPQLHFNEEVRRDAFNSGQMWAVNQIQWLIRKVRLVDRLDLGNLADKTPAGRHDQSEPAARQIVRDPVGARRYDAVVGFANRRLPQRAQLSPQELEAR